MSALANSMAVSSCKTKGTCDGGIQTTATSATRSVELCRHFLMILRMKGRDTFAASDNESNRERPYCYDSLNHMPTGSPTTMRAPEVVGEF